MADINSQKSCNSRAKIYGVLAVPALVFVASFASAITTSHAGAYTIAAFAFFVGMALAAVEILGLKVGGHHLRLERQIQAAQEENKQLKVAVESLLKSQFVLADAARYPMYGGPSVPHMRAIKEYLSPVASYLHDDIISSTFKELEQIDPSKDAKGEESSMTLAQRWCAASE